MFTANKQAPGFDAAGPCLFALETPFFFQRLLTFFYIVEEKVQSSLTEGPIAVIWHL